MANKKRLEMMVEMLNEHETLFKVVNLSFDMNEWGDAVSDDDEEIMVKDACGTSACAIGSACLYPPFKDIGLNGINCTSGFEPSYKQWHGWMAVRQFFGISETVAEYLFSNHKYKNDNVGPKDVAKRIKKFLKDGKSK